MRVIIENIALFLLPTLGYVGYRLLARRLGQHQVADGAHVLEGAPMLMLIAAGVALVLIVTIAFGSVSGGKPGEVYVPSRLENGKIVPGGSRAP